jgi:hypothetical protein
MIELEDDEQIILEIGPHYYFLLWPVFWSLFFSFIILAFAIVKTGLSFWFFLSFVVSAGIFWTYALLAYSRFYRNRAFLTNKRLWVKNQAKPFKTQVQEVDLKEIVEVGYTVTGIRASIIGAGNLIIKTRAGKIIIKNVADPESLKTKIIKIRDHILKNDK